MLFFVFLYFRHQQLTKMLVQFINKPTDQKPRESYGSFDLVPQTHTRECENFCSDGCCVFIYNTVMYYWTLLLPSISGAVVLLIAASLGENGGVLCGLFFPLLAKVTLSQYHRMSDYQRLEGYATIPCHSAPLSHRLFGFMIFFFFFCSLFPGYQIPSILEL